MILAALLAFLFIVWCLWSGANLGLIVVPFNGLLGWVLGWFLADYLCR
jgi:hypothetical protein